MRMLENILHGVGADNADQAVLGSLKKLIENGLIVRNDVGLWQVTATGLSELGARSDAPAEQSAQPPPCPR
jgi:repressor of nif and glnA expression